MKKDQPKGPPKDYFVPDFGLEEDVVDTLAHIKKEEKRLKHVWKPVQDENGVWIVPEAINNKSYTYKNDALVQLDADVDSDPICSSAGCNGPKATKGEVTHPMNYFVPNFGRDKDINGTWASLDWAEQSLDHHWDPVLKKDQPKGPPKDYKVPDFGLEEDDLDLVFQAGEELGIGATTLRSINRDTNFDNTRWFQPSLVEMG